MRFALLGSLEVRRGDNVVALGSPSQRRLLAVLAVNADTVVPAERLADALWSGNPPPSAAGSLQNHVSKLRRVIGAERVLTRPPGYQLVTEPDEIDLRHFERLALQAAGVDPTNALALIDEALHLCKGPPLAEFEYEDWARPIVVRIEGLHLAILERRIDVLLALGRSAEALNEAQTLVSTDPLREHAVGLLLRSLAAQDRAPEALRELERFRKALLEESGMRPSPTLVAIERSLLEPETPDVAPRVDPEVATPVEPSAAQPPTLTSTPSGVVTFLFTDIEGSTRLWARHPDEMRAALERHDGIVRTSLERAHGYVFATAGDSFAAAFRRPLDAVRAAIGIQRELRDATWPFDGGLRVRIGLHLGVADERGGNYFGSAVSLAARVEQAAHGGQIVLTEALAVHLDRHDLRPLGEHRLRGFDESIALFDVQVAGLESGHRPLRTERIGLSNLPPQRTSLLGREDAVIEVRQLLRTNRLVTLTGPGGVGKTSLALEVASREAAANPDTVFFIDLSVIAAGGDVTAQFFQALGIQPDGSGRPAQQLADALAERAALLCVDNCEHVLDQVAEMVAVLAPCRQLRALTTSREPLSIPGERTWRVPTLPIRPTSVQLFESRATAIDSTFRLDPADETVVAAICQRVDGLPLAIELAAARVRTLSLADIRDGLDHRFRLLGSNTRGSVARHRTLEAVIGWSYDLLTPEHQRVLRGLSIFEDTFDLRDVVGATGLDEFDAIDALDALVAKSLVDTSWPARPPMGGDRGPANYRLLESLWSFAHDRLIDAGEGPSTQIRYVDHLVAVEGAPADMRMTDVSRRLRVRNFRNLRSAANWALEAGRVGDATRLALGRAVAIVENGVANEGLAWLAGREDLGRSDRLWALNGCAYLAIALGDHDRARMYAQECLTLAAGEPFDAMPNAFGFAAMIDLQTDNARSLALTDEAIGFAPRTPSGALQLPMLHHVRGLAHLHARRLTAALDDSRIAVERTRGTQIQGIGVVTHLVALAIIGDHDAFDAAFELWFDEAEADSIVADQRWNRRLLGYLRTPVTDDDASLTAAVASEALAPGGGQIGQRCADLLAVDRWRDPNRRDALIAEGLALAAVSASAFGALATEAYGRSHGWTDDRWPEQLAHLSRIAADAGYRAGAVRRAWELSQPTLR